ncbi:chondroitin sulfate N-acetylgalactosaminyltransferase 1-like [Pollicipes pollicipes]|uniref:chondroitin sulfate N-acetylgalactosaminyltransferase 1-like n=1 Tax=Pollicipes pollicipes TaxID=41117 RepID=UPI0018850A57|nr:chondroitin sulfate N-acetylgalactosaminyltransferase 1-like [Pollicipes pollicipes]
MRRRQLTMCGALLLLVSVPALLLLSRHSTSTARRPHPRSPATTETRPLTSVRSADLINFTASTGGQGMYPWQHVHYGHWRRHVHVPGDVRTKQRIEAGPEIDELHRVLDLAAAELQRSTDEPAARPSDSRGARLRFVPGLGTEYEVYFPALRPATASEFHTVRLQRGLGPLEVTYAGLAGSRLVNIVLPYYGRFAALEAFVGRFRQLVLDAEAVVLTVVHFSEGVPALEGYQERLDRAGVAELVRETNEALGGDVPRVRLLEERGAFSHGAGWLAAAANWDKSHDVILFLCNIDMVFGREFLQRCRANSQPNGRVYYPMVFSTYNPEIVYGVIKKQVIPILTNYEKEHLIHENLGYWLDTEYEMSCQYLSDFRKFGVQFANQASESFAFRLYERFVKSEIQVIRMADRDLVQLYHRAHCTKEMGRESFNKCLKKKVMNEASKLEWGLWVYKNMGDTDDVEAFLKMVNNFKMPDGLKRSTNVA